jgi:hypothetical protein
VGDALVPNDGSPVVHISVRGLPREPRLEAFGSSHPYHSTRNSLGLLSQSKPHGQSITVVITKDGILSIVEADGVALGSSQFENFFEQRIRTAQFPEVNHLSAVKH